MNMVVDGAMRLKFEYCGKCRVDTDGHGQVSSSEKTDGSWFDDEVAMLTDELAEDLGKGLQARVMITRAVPGLPLSDCGLRAGDIVVALDGEPILSVPQLISILITNGQRHMNFTVVRTLREPTAAELTAHRQYLVETFRQVCLRHWRATCAVL